MPLELREYQKETLDALRKGFADGHNVQILYSPTGGGKTEMAIALLEATKKKGNRSAMILDRIILTDQTSQRLDKYNIDHGVLMSQHWRYRPYEHIQVCSAQTIEARGSFPGLNLMIVDECHTKRQQTIEFIKNNPDIKVIGLSATPFTKGLGDTYTNVVSTVTTKQLVDQKVLAPLRVFISKEIDMTGAKKLNTGEWTAKESEKRGMQITGDIVSEWIKKTHEIFGKPVKTIVFCAGVAHGADLAKKFNEEGYNFISISYKEDGTFKQEVIEDFAKPDTEIHGLIATDILTKGFDVPDVMIGVSARPFSKSLSSHIQQMGRVMRSHSSKQYAVWLDHSGNYLRFQEEWEDVYNNGVSELDDTREKVKKEKEIKEKEAAKCPMCSAFWPSNSDVCINCGHVRERKNKVFEVAGEMEELAPSASRDEKQEWWGMCYHMVEYRGWNPGRAAHTYKEKFGVWPKGLADTPVEPSKAFDKAVKESLKAYLKSKRAA